MNKIFKISILLLGLLGLGWVAYKMWPLSKTDKLYEAISDNNIVEARKLIDEGANVNGDKDLGISRTPLAKAVYVGNVEMVKLLLEKGANATNEAKGQRTILDIATGIAMGSVGPASKIVRDNQKKIIPLLLEANAPSKYPPVIPALLSGNLERVKQLTAETKEMLKTNQPDILRAAINSGDKAIIDYAINTLIGHNAIEKSGKLLDWAIDSEDPAIIDYMLTHPLTDINAKIPPFDFTPLHSAVMHPNDHGNPEAVQKLLEMGANPNIQDNEHGETPLHIALRWGNREPIVKLLIEHGADLTIKNKEGKSAQDLLNAQNNTNFAN